MRKTIARMLTAVMLVAGVALSAAGVAGAQGDVKSPDTPEGNYTVRIDGQAETTWEIYPICVPTVGDLREPLILPVACRLKVTPAGRGGSEATQIGGRWTFQSNTFDSVKTCPDGSTALQKEIYSFDGATLTGSVQIFNGAGVCDQPAGMVELPLTMTYSRPLDIPVTPYPLICEPGGLRRCF
ncbi:hypothetical protein SAMN04489835_3581 [Mycolicibacterium rutilum]|uniref:Secreted protein n=1 Tax=Mycolicibacterium rutilum TaxID=370526 RepID=A0A1H6KHD1_MYCRU|nr:hypothetical protein [Mycolicibacterium rutilum]SEH74600.1 hypothetical protein SAMN04489835_3581 [Mycolicibacterium rutilum]